MKHVPFPGLDRPRRPARKARRWAPLLCAPLAVASCGPPNWPGGIHALLAWSEQGVRVVEVPPETPAQRADLRPGDRIVRVDGKDLEGRSSEGVQRLLSGEVGSTASIEVLRDGRRLTLEIVRAPYTKKGAEP